MKISDLDAVTALYKRRSVLIGQLTSTQSPDLNHFNVQLQGRSADPELHQCARLGVLRSLCRQLRKLDDELYALGVQIDVDWRVALCKEYSHADA